MMYQELLPNTFGRLSSGDLKEMDVQDQPYPSYQSRKKGIGFSWLSQGGSTCLSCDEFARTEI